MTCDISFSSKALSKKVISQDHCVVPYKAVTLTAGHLKFKVKGQGLKCQSQFECQTGWEREFEIHHLSKCKLN